MLSKLPLENYLSLKQSLAASSFNKYKEGASLLEHEI
jgi:hypothetical protein